MTRHDAGGEAAADWEPADSAAGPEQALADWQQLQQVRLAMDRLDPRCQTLLGLLFRDDDDRVAYDQVGQQLGIPVGSIGPTRSRCLAKLRRLLD
jgi:DNA-directed RNA polymerase specialized sigma24 family protein